jgi:hypothetical protein
VLTDDADGSFSIEKESEIKMKTELENESCLSRLNLAREKRQENLAAKQSHEKLCLGYLEKLAEFIEDTMKQFLAEAPGKPIVDLTLSAAAAPVEIRLRIDGDGRIFDVTDELPF